jgi:uncharacterized membrane protein YphA (DoxX/SURF4 family)
MDTALIKTGRFLYALGIAAVGIHMVILHDFRPEILPAFPAWAHRLVFIPVATGIAFLVCAVVISGLVVIKPASKKMVCLWLGFFFLFVLMTCHLPYTLWMSSFKTSRLDVWFGPGEALAYSGGAFVMAGSFQGEIFKAQGRSNFNLLLEKCIPAGRIFFSVLMILFGFSHFVFTAFVSTMVPAFMGMPLFWTYFVGVALIGAGIAITFNIWIKPVALLLAFMLFLFFIFFHLPDAVANPMAGKGNEIVRAIIALMFCGIALVIAETSNYKRDLQ